MVRIAMVYLHLICFRILGVPDPCLPTAETVRVAKRIYVGNLSWQVSWQDLKDHMRQAGEVIYADVMTEGGKGSQQGGGRSKVLVTLRCSASAHLFCVQGCG